MLNDSQKIPYDAESYTMITNAHCLHMPILLQIIKNNQNSLKINCNQLYEYKQLYILILSRFSIIFKSGTSCLSGLPFPPMPVLLRPRSLLTVSAYLYSLLLVLEHSMRKICVRIGIRKTLRMISASDLSKIYFIKKRSTPKLPKFIEADTDCEQEKCPQILVPSSQM